MLYANKYDIQQAAQRHRDHPVLSKATKFLAEFCDEVNEHSDGWAYWSAPVKAAKQLIELIHSNDATEAQFKKALSPIRAFYTRRGNAAGLKFPTIAEDKVSTEPETIDITPNFPAITKRYLDSALLQYRATADGLDKLKGEGWRADSAKLTVCREVHSIVSELNVAIQALDSTEALADIRKRLSEAVREVNTKLQQFNT